ncbi:MAG: 6-hydroxymethylpterin diphosphokinase MptE-like protein [Pseudomonadota bacterium]
MDSEVQRKAQDVENSTKLMEATFATNLLAFKEYVPEIYEYFKNYQNKEVLLGFDDNNHPNLFSNNHWAYPKNPREESIKQVDLYSTQPFRFLYRPKISPEEQKNAYFCHTYRIAEMCRLSEEMPNNKKVLIPDQIPMMAVIGSGLGYHITDLTERFNIRNLFIYEPYPDVFYASMFTTNYYPILKKQSEDFKTITMIIGCDWSVFINSLAHDIKNKTRALSAQIYVFRHYFSEKTDEALQKTYDLIHRVYQGMGFAEDELISISHTLLNLKTAECTLKPARIAKPLPEGATAIIVGSGPSVDQAIEFIKENKDRVVIFSCSSSLNILHKNGIKPDFHVEIERGQNVPTWLNGINDPDYLKQIDFICLNSTHPENPGKFKKAIYGFKSNDTAAVISESILSKDQIEILSECNPTAGNGALAAAAQIGFKNIYLFGIDFGQKDIEGNHHSKDTLYYTNEKLKQTLDVKDYMKTPGNFADEVYTTQAWDMGRFAMEVLLDRMKDIKCFNCSDGIKIRLATPTPIDTIHLNPTKMSKDKLLQFIHANRFHAFPKVVAQEFESEWMKSFMFIETIISHFKGYLKPQKKLEYLMDIIELQTDFFMENKKHNEAVYSFLYGTLNHLQIATLSYLSELPEGDLMEEYMEKFFVIWRKHIDECLMIARDHIYDPTGSFSIKPYIERDIKNV